jgi:hypothetical protein
MYIYTVPGPGSHEAGRPPAGVLQPQSPVMAGLRFVRWHEIQEGLSSFLAPGTVVLGCELLVRSQGEIRGCAVVMPLIPSLPSLPEHYCIVLHWPAGT